MKFEYFKARNINLGIPPQWYFHIKGDNGEIIAQSEGYRNRLDCLESIKTIRYDALGSPLILIDKTKPAKKKAKAKKK